MPKLLYHCVDEEEREIMRTLVIIGGHAPSVFPMDKKGYDRIVAADSGYDTAMSFPIVPDLVVGDFDSTSFREELLEKGYRQVPRDKDETDTELALQNIDGEYDILGGGEGRLDHILSILSLFPRYGYPRLWFTRSDTMISIKGRKEFSLPLGTELSLFSIFGSTVTTKGLFWDIENRRLDQAFLSLSNRTKDESIIIESDEPVFMRVAPDDFSFLSSHFL